VKINWLWDTRLSQRRVKQILKDEGNPRFYIYAEKLFSRTQDPKTAFAFIPKRVFLKQWPVIKKRVEKDTWAQEKAKRWQAFYDQSLKALPKPVEASAERMNIAQQIRDIRIKNGYTQRDMAQKLGVIQQYVSNLETGRENFTVDTLKRIALILNKQLDIQLK
jgi:DNA-binding XRE family transcriptional regulator